MARKKATAPFPNSFTDQFTYTIDHRGRINFPATFRRALSEKSKNSVVVARGLDGCLIVFPKEVWEKHRAEITVSPYLSLKQQRRLQRRITYGAKESTFDKQGRITIPDVLIKEAKLEKEVFILGQGDRVELWNPEVFKAYISKDDRAVEDILEEQLTHSLPAASKYKNNAGEMEKPAE